MYAELDIYRYILGTYALLVNHNNAKCSLTEVLPHGLGYNKDLLVRILYGMKIANTSGYEGKFYLVMNNFSYIFEVCL